MWIPVNSSHGHVVTRSTRHRSTRHIHVWSHSQLVTSEHITKPPVPVAVICTPSGTVLNTDGVITAICVTLMYTADYRSRRQITLLRKARSTRHNAVKHDGQLVTRFYSVTSWPCDELTGSPQCHGPTTFSLSKIVAKMMKTVTVVHKLRARITRMLRRVHSQAFVCCQLLHLPQVLTWICRSNSINF